MWWREEEKYFNMSLSFHLLCHKSEFISCSHYVVIQLTDYINRNFQPTTNNVKLLLQQGENISFLSPCH